MNLGINYKESYPEIKKGLILIKLGKIIETKTKENGNVIHKILLEDEEVISLKNAMKNINMFCSDLCTEEINIIKRGNKGVTKFFEIPFKLRSRKTKDMKDIYYQKLETKTKIFYIYVLKKGIKL